MLKLVAKGLKAVCNFFMRESMQQCFSMVVKNLDIDIMYNNLHISYKESKFTCAPRTDNSNGLVIILCGKIIIDRREPIIRIINK